MQQQFARPTDGYTEALLRDILAIAPGDVPAHVIDAMDMLLMDTTGVMLGARTAPGVQAVQLGGYLPMVHAVHPIAAPVTSAAEAPAQPMQADCPSPLW